MKKMKTIKLILATCLISLVGVSTSHAQQDPHFTQYFDNMLFVNPAYSGSNGVLNATAMHREQWAGFEGRPHSTTLGIHSPLPYESVGVGLSFVNDKIGPMNQTMIYGDVSYSLKFKNHNGRLSFGLKGGVNIINIGDSHIDAAEPNDPTALSSIRNNVNPNFGFGIYYRTPSFFAGLSIPKMLQRGYDGISETNLEQRHYYGTLGGVIQLTEKWKLRPSTMVRITDGMPVGVDLTLAAIFNDKIWFGANYRLLAAAGAFVQLQVTPQLRLGIGSDFGLQSLRNYNYGTFEIMLSYDFSFTKGGVVTPRYF